MYCRRSLTISFIDHLLKELEDSFSSNTKVATGGLCLVPSVISKIYDWKANVKDLASLLQADLPAPLSLTTELQCWKRTFVHYESEKLPDGPIDALNQCDTTPFPNISTLLKKLGTIPVTSCEAKRTSSVLRQIKPFLRTTITEERLSGLSVLLIYQNISIGLDDAVDHFSRKDPRKLQ